MSQRFPAEYEICECVCEQLAEDDLMLLMYTKERGWFEPITNRSALPVVGKVLRWRYRNREPKDRHECL